MIQHDLSSYWIYATRENRTLLLIPFEKRAFLLLTSELGAPKFFDLFLQRFSLVESLSVVCRDR